MGRNSKRAEALSELLEGELVRLGRWSKAAIDPARLEGMGPFGMRTLAPEEWMQFVLIPRLHELGASGEAMPRESELAAWAVKQYDGVAEAGGILEILRALDAEARGAEAQAKLDEAAMRSLPRICYAAAIGSSGEVAHAIDRGADVCEQDAQGHTALHYAAACGEWQLRALAMGTLREAVEAIELHSPINSDHPRARVLRELTAERSDLNARCGSLQLTPLMIATFFGHHTLVQALLESGADPALRDRLGRTADRFAVFSSVARALSICRRQPAIRAAYLAQVHAPLSQQYTSPFLALELVAPLPLDAFASWPVKEEPLVVTQLGDDAISRLVRIEEPIFSRAL